MKEGDILVCFENIEQIGGMRFRQSYFIVGKKYKVSKRGKFDTSGNSELVVPCEYGWNMSIDSDFADKYLCTEQKWREMKLERILNDTIESDK